MTSKAAVIDIGTNSVRLLIAQVDEQTVKCLKQNLETTRLGKGLSNHRGVLLLEDITNTYKAVSEFYRTCKQEGATTIKLIGTSALREAVNRTDLTELISRKLGLEVEILSEAQEALLSYRGAVFSLSFPEDQATFIDVGGGSTEAVWKDSEGLQSCSFPLGALRLKEYFFTNDPPLTSEIRKLKEYLDSFIRPYCQIWSGNSLIGAGGTITTLASVKQGLTDYQPRLLHGVRLTQEEIENMLAHFLNQPLEKRKEIMGLPPNRADIIISGTLIVSNWLQQCGQEEIIVSEADLLAGALTYRQKIIL